MSHTVFKASNVTYTYPDGTTALQNLSIEIPKDGITAIIGPNGSGKSTLLLVLSGLLTPTKGTVLYKGAKIEKSRHRLRKETAIVFQDPDDQLFAPTVYEDMAFGPKLLGLEGERLQKLILKVAKTLSIDLLLDKPPYRLSGGEKKKVALATALVLDPEVLLLDEPFAELAQDALTRLIGLLFELKSRGKTIVFTGHDTDLAAELADHICIIAGGSIIAGGNARKVLTREYVLKRAGLKLPTATRIYKALGNDVDESSPITVEELIKYLREDRWKVELELSSVKKANSTVSKPHHVQT
jgi:cobalt/nickel transport system ATP-binding protein